MSEHLHPDQRFEHVTACCKAVLNRPDLIHWNEGNYVWQCHACGHRWEPVAEAKAQPGDARSITFHCGDKTLHLDKDGDTCAMSWQGKGEKRHLAVQEITTPDFGECVAWMRPMVTLPQRVDWAGDDMRLSREGDYVSYSAVLAALTAAGVAWEQG